MTYPCVCSDEYNSMLRHFAAGCQEADSRREDQEEELRGEDAQVGAGRQGERAGRHLQETRHTRGQLRK